MIKQLQDAFNVAFENKVLLGIFSVVSLVLMSVKGLMMNDVTDGDGLITEAFSLTYTIIEFVLILLFSFFSLTVLNGQEGEGSAVRTRSVWAIIGRSYVFAMIVFLAFLFVTMSLVTLVFGDLKLTEDGTPMAATSMLVAVCVSSGASIWSFWSVSLRSLIARQLNANGKVVKQGVFTTVSAWVKAWATTSAHAFMFMFTAVFVFFASVSHVLGNAMVDVLLTLIMQLSMWVPITWYYLEQKRDIKSA